MYFNQWIFPLIAMFIGLIAFFIHYAKKEGAFYLPLVLFILVFITFMVNIVVITEPTGKTTYESAKVGWFSKNEYSIIAVLEDETIIKSNDARFVNSPVETLGVLKTIKHNGLGYVHSVEHSFASVEYLSTLK